MPNNRRGFGGVKYVYYEDANGNYSESFQANSWPTVAADVPVGGLYRSGNDLKVVAATGSNLLTNGGFESGNTTGWTVPGGITNTITTTSTLVAEGTNSLYCLFPSASNRIYRFVTLVVGKRYQCSGKFSVTVGAGLLIVQETATDKVVGMANSILGSAGFEKVSFDFIATVTGYTFIFGGLRPNDAMYVDDFQVCEVT